MGNLFEGTNLSFGPLVSDTAPGGAQGTEWARNQDAWVHLGWASVAAIAGGLLGWWGMGHVGGGTTEKVAASALAGLATYTAVHSWNRPQAI